VPALVEHVRVDHRGRHIGVAGVYGQAADQVLGKMGGFNYYIAKPCDPNVLLNLLRSV